MILMNFSKKNSAFNFQWATLGNRNFEVVEVVFIVDVLICLITDRNFVIANAQVENTPLIYCNDGFCQLSGYSRAEVMQKSAACEFMHGPQTNRQMVIKLREGLQGNTEKLMQLCLYKKDGKVQTILKMSLTVKLR